MNFKKLSVFAISMALISVLPNAIGDDNKNSEESWKSSSNDSQYWAKPTKIVGSDLDQQQLDAQSPSIPGLKVVPAKVFEVRPSSNNAAAITPLGGGNLINHNGATLPNVNIYAIFWGPSSTLNSTYQSNTTSFLNGLNCSGSSCTGLTSTIKQYVGNSTLGLTFKNSFVDTSNPPSSSPSTSSIANEVVKVVTKTQTLDPQGLYLVFTSNFPSKAGYCAWHSAAKATVGSTTTSFTFGYMPNLSAQLNGCGAHFLPNYFPSGLGESFDSLFNVTTHELYETMSDPMTSGSGWYDNKGYENGDKCSWYWSTTITQNTGTQNTRTFYVQQEYSNATSSCAASS